MDAPDLQQSIWHVSKTEAILAHFASSEAGLTGSEARARLDVHGPNRLPEASPAGKWVILLRQFRSPLIYILALAALVAFFVHSGDPTDSLFILAVLLLNAGIGAYQEWKAEKSSRALQKLLKIKASVLRDGETREIDAEQVVP